MLKFLTLAVLLSAVSAEWSGMSWGGRGWEGGRGGEERKIGRGGGGEGRGWGGGEGGGWEEGKRFDYYSPPKYEFNYGVKDEKTGDYKQQSEERKGDKVRGEYSFLEADGTRRIVKYEANDKDGFNAKVIRKGKAWHPIGWERKGGEGGGRRWAKEW